MGNISYTTIQMMKKSDKAEVCFAALDDFDKPVIVKRLFEANPEIYRVISEIHNPHLPQIYAMEETEGELLVVEEYIDGNPLDEYIPKQSLSDGQILELMLQFCDALEVLHNCEPPVIHRDIKPSNILIDKDGVLKIIDFDASRQYKGEKNTSDTRLLGTIEYAAPEQFGYAQTDPRSDIYSLGVVLSEIKLSEKSSFAKAWKHIVDKCTSFDPENRYKDIRHVKKDLQACIWRIKHPAVVMWMIAGVAALVFIGLLVVGSKFIQSSGEATNPTPMPTPTPPIGELTPEPTNEPTGGSTEPSQVTLTNTPMPTLTPTATSTPTPEEEYPDYDGIVLLEDEMIWHVTQMETITCEFHPEASCEPDAVYVCTIAEADDPYSEVLELLPETMYKVSEDGKGLTLLSEFSYMYSGRKEMVLYITFDSGHGERLKIQFAE